MYKLVSNCTQSTNFADTWNVCGKYDNIKKAIGSVKEKTFPLKLFFFTCKDKNRKFKNW